MCFGVEAWGAFFFGWCEKNHYLVPHSGGPVVGIERRISKKEKKNTSVQSNMSLRINLTPPDTILFPWGCFGAASQFEWMSAY